MPPRGVTVALLSAVLGVVGCSGEPADDGRPLIVATTTIVGEPDGQLRCTLATIPSSRRTLITSHAAFGYFAETTLATNVADELAAEVGEEVRSAPPALSPNRSDPLMVSVGRPASRCRRLGRQGAGRLFSAGW